MSPYLPSLKILVALTLILAALVAYSLSYRSFLTPTEVLSVSFLDVGQGDAIYIRAPNGNDVLIDGGPDNSVMPQLRSVMPGFDSDINLVIETHPDKDHIAGLVPVLKKYEVKNVLRSEISSGTSFDRALQDELSNLPRLNMILVRRGERIILDANKGAYLDILFPDQDTSLFKETNDASVVARLTYGTQSFLLTGDSPSTIEHFIVNNEKDTLTSTVLKLGHHGSKFSSSEEYLDAVHPSYAIVSAGQGNRYNHPNPETVSRVQARGIQMLSTMDHGTITFQTDGTHIWTK